MRAAECTRINHFWGLFIFFLSENWGGGREGGRIDLASTLAFKLFPRVRARVVGGGGQEK